MPAHGTCCLAPAGDKEVVPRRIVARSLASNGPDKWQCSIAGSAVACKRLLLRQCRSSSEGIRLCLYAASPGKAKRIHEAKVGDIVHAAVDLFCKDSRIGDGMLCILSRQPEAAVLMEIAPQVRLVDREPLLCTLVRHAPELASHAGMVRCVPALPQRELPVRIPKPEERHAICMDQDIPRKRLTLIELACLGTAQKAMLVDGKIPRIGSSHNRARFPVKPALGRSSELPGPGSRSRCSKAHAKAASAIPERFPLDMHALRPCEVRDDAAVPDGISERTGRFKVQYDLAPGLCFAVQILRFSHSLNTPPFMKAGSQAR